MACARRRAVGQTDSRIVRRPMDRPTVRPSGRLLDRVKALVQRVRHVARGVVPRREVEGGVERLLAPREDRKSTTSELQSLAYLVCRLLLEKKKTSAHPPR